MRAKLILLAMVMSACPKKEEAAKPAPAVPVKKAPEPAPVVHAPNAECEFIGSWSPGETKPATVEFVAQAEPCLPLNPAPTMFGKQVIPTADSLFAEFFIPQGTVGHLCLYGRDAAGQVVGLAAYPKNPVKFEGDGEVMFSGLKLDLAPLPTAAAAPAQKN